MTRILNSDNKHHNGFHAPFQGTPTRIPQSVSKKKKLKRNVKSVSSM